jgi:hypothetical protein
VAHLTQAFQRTFPEHPKIVHKLKQALYRGHAHQILPTVRLAQLNNLGDPDRVASLLGYLHTNQAGVYGARSLRPRLSAQAKLVCVQGSGAVEKHIDLTICRRFKGQGMRWTRTGANRLLKLRLQELARAAYSQLAAPLDLDSRPEPIEDQTSQPIAAANDEAIQFEGNQHSQPHSGRPILPSTAAIVGHYSAPVAGRGIAQGRSGGWLRAPERVL